LVGTLSAVWALARGAQLRSSTVTQSRIHIPHQIIESTELGVITLRYIDSELLVYRDHEVQ
jgi:hypothetical protein